MSEKTKRERFIEYAAYVLAELDEAHPHRIVLVPSKVVAALGQEQGKDTTLLCQASLDWLTDNGYFHCSRRPGSNATIAEHVFAEASLTEKGWTKLGVEMDLRGIKRRAGDVLRDEVKKIGENTRSGAIGEIVGQVIGGI